MSDQLRHERDPFLALAWTAESNQEDAQFGGSVSAAGDVNGDGYGDVVVGAPFYDHGEADEGRAFLYFGSALGLDATAAWTAESHQEFAWFGWSASSAGDVNGDGYGDVVVAAPNYDNGFLDEGGVQLYLGSATGLTTSSAWTAESDEPGAQFGCSVASAGDVNGDGYDDVVVGAGQAGLQLSGWARVYLGSESGLTPSPAWTVGGDQLAESFGGSVSSAGDVNGDGYDDVVIGASLYSDLDDPEGSDVGRAYVYLGAATGLATTVAWTAEADETMARFGGSVSSAGDVNGDGYGDIIVGAHAFENGQDGEGGAFVYLGSASGLATTAAWTAESDQEWSNFGGSVSSAGDVNGDGYGDVVVGAFTYDNGETDEGRAYLYLGSAAGLATVAAWTAEPDQDFSDFGLSVSDAGDVNGDGYADIVVGAPDYRHGESSEGAASLYLGGRVVDPDLDGVPAGSDICPYVADPGQEDADGDGVGDACVPLTLEVGAVSVALGLSVEVFDALPGETVIVFLADGPPEVGPCPARAKHAGLCLDLGGGLHGRRGWGVLADADGHAALVGATLPTAALPGAIVTVQAAADRGVGGVKSGPVETIVVP